MTPIFLYGTLCHLPLLAVVLGRAPEVTEARLAGHYVLWVAEEQYPLIQPGGDGAAGYVFDATPEDVARLDFYEGAFGYKLRPVTVETEAGPVDAQVYWPPQDQADGVPWDLGEWVAEWGALTELASREAMASFGVEPAEQVARRWHMIRARAQADLDAAKRKRPRSVGRTIPRRDVKVSAQYYDLTGFFAVESFELSHPRFDGGPPIHINRSVFRAGQAATVLPYDPARDRVLLVEQFRIAPFVQTDPDPWLLEPVAGIVDAGETPEETARREAVEEAGVTLGALELIGRYYPSPGATVQFLHSFCGIADLPDDLSGHGGLLDEGEDIAVHLVDYAHFVDMLHSGELINAPAILSAQWLMLHRDRLRAGA